ncbi:cold shock domain-containing protein [Tardiphaga sp. vice304]|uniref:cold-shock protein n=1 Tax=Tardiphaga sp. vice304 TaxID=2592817 RepID=UPI001163DA93|nr:cold shock domain-containing protein [Tardiphaga sp. vice304]QDM28394.1 cold shock domain-containing protein [Tardiphaga sp. vice304]
MATGELSWFDADRGFGFITPEGGGKDVFLHIRDVISAGIFFLREGDPINYELSTDGRSGKACATNISLPAPQL